MRILGIDPGLSSTGYAVLDVIKSKPSLVEAGVIKPNKKEIELPGRLKSIHYDFLTLLEEFLPEKIAVEDLYSHYQHPKTAIIMGHCRGVILLGCAEAKIDVVSFAATKVKKSITGNGRASKIQVGTAVANYFGLTENPNPNDVSDAIAVALTLSNYLLHQY